MIAALVRKELRAQAPFLVLIALLILSNVVEYLIASYPDLFFARQALGELGKGGSSAEPAARFLLLFALGSGLLVRDFEDGTMELLDALPVSRRALFAVKVAFAFGVVVFMATSVAGLALVRFHLSRTSLVPEIPFGVLGVGFVAHVVQSSLFLALALALSFTRRFAWVCAGLMYWTWSALEVPFPELARLSPFVLTAATFRGQEWVLAGAPLVFAIVTTVLLGLVALFLFERTGDRILPTIGGDQRAHRFAGWAVILLTTILGISVFVRFVMKSEQPAEPGTVTYSSFGTARGHSRVYTMTYPANLTERAEDLLAVADEVHDRVRALLDVPDALTGTIAVDATGSASGTAGLTHGSKVRLELLAAPYADNLSAILGHETTHVFAGRLSRDRSGDPSAAPFFHEGLATYVEYRLFQDEAALAALRLTAAAAWVRGGIAIERVTDRAALAERTDPNVVYPVGELFFARLVERHGDGVLRKIFEAFTRPGVPENLRGIEAWRDAFQAAGVDLDSIAADWSGALAELAETRADELAKLPRLTAVVTPEDDDLKIVVRDPIPEGWVPVARVRTRSDAKPEAWVNVWDAEHEGDATTFTVRSSLLRGRTAGYQLGLLELGSNRFVWEPWVRIVVN